MTLTLELPPELEADLAAEAARRGLPLADYAIEVLEARRVVRALPPPGSPMGFETGAEVVAYWQREGVIGSRPDIVDPEEYARALRRESETRGRRAGLLERLMEIKIDGPADFSASLVGDRGEAERAE